MTDEMVEAAARRLAECEIQYWERFTSAAQHMAVQSRLKKACAALEAAAPILLAAERERIAQAIEAFFPDPHAEGEDCIFMHEAAKIARGMTAEADA